MKIENLIGLSKPLTKLIEVVSNGIGAISKPYMIRKTADAKAYEITKIAETIKDQQDTLKSIDYKNTQVSLTSIDKDKLIHENFPLSERTQKRIEYQENKRQFNIESITQKAFQNIETETEVSNDLVDNDWTTRFFNYAQDISNDELQELWAKILAGEVKQPKSFSLRTLEVVRNLLKQEVETFSKVANYSIISNRDVFLFNHNKVLEKMKISFDDISLLQEIGLLQSSQFVNYSIFENKEPKKLGFEFGDLIILMLRKENAPEQNFEIISFTNTGRELLNLIIKKPDFKYIQYFAKKLKHELVDIKYAHILERKNDLIKHSQPLIEIPDIEE